MGSHKVQAFLGFYEVPTRNFTRALIAEFVGTAILMIGISASVATINTGDSVSTESAAVASGMTVASVIWIFNHASGAHINPSVSLGFFVTGHISLVKLVGFIFVQCCGATAGTATVMLMVPREWKGSLASTVFSEGVTLLQGFVVEFVSTFVLVMGIFACSDRLRVDHGGSAALSIGTFVFMQGLWAGKLTGCSMNPARSLGPAILSGTWENHWVYWAAPLLGGSLGALFYHHVMADKPQEADRHTLEKRKSCSPESSLRRFTDIQTSYI